MTNSGTQGICWESAVGRAGGKILWEFRLFEYVSTSHVCNGQSSSEESLAALGLTAANISYSKWKLCVEKTVIENRWKRQWQTLEWLKNHRVESCPTTAAKHSHWFPQIPGSSFISETPGVAQKDVPWRILFPLSIIPSAVPLWWSELR